MRFAFVGFTKAHRLRRKPARCSMQIPQCREAIPGIVHHASPIANRALLNNANKCVKNTCYVFFQLYLHTRICGHSLTPARSGRNIHEHNSPSYHPYSSLPHLIATLINIYYLTLKPTMFLSMEKEKSLQSHKGIFSRMVLVLMSLLVSTAAWAQANVTGTVVDQNDEPLHGRHRHRERHRKRHIHRPRR